MRNTVNDLAVGKQPAVLFLDTEWADDDGRELVSLALVPGGQYGEFTGAAVPSYYAERDPLPLANAYVTGVVYPLLDRGVFAKTDQEFSRSLSAYIADARHPRSHVPPVIIATHANDFALLDTMLAATQQTPAYRAELRYSESLLDRIRVAFAKDAELARRRHHALVDAQVLQSVYRGWFEIGRSR
jgi:hypothetical protein